MARSAFSIVWQDAPETGQVEVAAGHLLSATLEQGAEVRPVKNGRFRASGPAQLRVEVDAGNAGLGPTPTAISVRAREHSFTFLLRDVDADFPILIPEYGVAVTTAGNKRTFEQIQHAVRERKQLTNLQRIEQEPEESYDQAANSTRELIAPIWMGISRDVRIFEMNLRCPMQITDTIQPRFHGNGYCNIDLEKDYLPPKYGLVAGRGWGCTEKTWRQLDERVLPIFRAGREDEDLKYELTAFVTLEKSPLKQENIRGTHFLVADGLSINHAFTEEQEKEYQSLRDPELKAEEETVLCCRIVATNTAPVPRYAFFKAVHPVCGMYGSPNEDSFDGNTGYGKPKDSESVFAISLLNGRPMPQQEIAVLVKPGQTCIYDFFIPHRPISTTRAASLAQRDLQRCLEECRAFWRGKLNTAGRMHVPESRVDEMVQAGLLQLDINTYGREPDGPLTVADGIYGPVSAEVWLNIHFFDSLGLHDQARRGLQYFLEKQHDDGFMQNFTGYMLDTGCVLFALGEHYRYTRDDNWVKSIRPKVLKSCQFIIDWRARNKREDLRGKGYGLMEGKVADPEDQERTFMLNAYAYAGLRGIATMLEQTDPEESRRLSQEADEMRIDIRTAFLEALADGPVIPLADGSWSPTAGAWVGTKGPVSLMTDGRNWWTHGSMNIRDDALGPIHLIAREVIDAKEPLATALLNFSNELGFSRNVASSQPYYSQHPLVHLRRGEAKAFLKAWYNAFASMAARKTYSWWEHFWHMSPHKTHETAEFLMQTRWMLWLEEGEQLSLLRGIPRAWLEDGKSISLERVASYFGPISLKVNSKVKEKRIDAHLECSSDRRPKRVEIRLPHPTRARIARVEGGLYRPEFEAVVIDNFRGSAHIRVHFEA